MLNWIKARFNNPPVIVTENGWGEAREVDGSDLDDPMRVYYYKYYINNVLKGLPKNIDGLLLVKHFFLNFKSENTHFYLYLLFLLAINEGCNVLGYTAWSLLGNLAFIHIFVNTSKINYFFKLFSDNFEWQHGYK